MKTRSFLLAAGIVLAMAFTLSSCAPTEQQLKWRAQHEAMMSSPSIETVYGFDNQLTWLESNAESGGTYTIETYGGCNSATFSYKDRSNITIILKGAGSQSPTIYCDRRSGLFTVGSGVTLILDNVTLKGPSEVDNRLSARALVNVDGTLIMNEGSTITNGMNLNGNGGGVYVGDGGTFIMKGGTITGNTCFPVPNAALMAATKGKYGAVREKHYKGGGVYVSDKGTFTKTGGTITGYASDSKNGNAVMDLDGRNVVKNSGHAVYFDGWESKSIDNTIGPEVSFHFSKGKFGDVPKEEPKREEITAEQ